MLEWTGERYVPWIQAPELGYEHMHRYAFATQFVRNKRVLDLASGEGYGSNLLAQTAKQVIGIDLDNKAVEHASNKYLKRNLEFKVGSITDVPIDGHGLFDVIVCFEALEHVEDHQKLLSEAKRLLVRDGFFLVSTPNKTLYTDEPNFSNPFHVHELYFDQFKALLGEYFRQVKFLGQRIYCNSSLWPIYPEKRTRPVEFVVEKTPNEFTFVGPEKRAPMYFIAVASNSAKDIGGHVSFLVDISNELVGQRDHTINRLRADGDELNTKLSGLTNQMVQFQRQLQQRQEDILKLTEFMKQKDQRISAITEQLKQTQDRFAQDVAWLQSVIEEHQKLLKAREHEISALTEQTSALEAIYSSRSWKALMFYCRIRDRLLPEDTFRRAFVRAVFRSMLAFRSSLTWRKLASSSSRSVPASSDISDVKREESQPLIAEEQLKLETEQVQAVREPVTEPISFTDDDEDQQYEVLSSRIAALRRTRIEELQLNPPTLVSIPETDFIAAAHSLIFEAHEDPQVSIIIPVFNNLKFTLECLTSLIQQTAGFSYEVIVVDDGSTDRTQEVLSRALNVLYLKNEKNVGFVHSCNRGAEAAKGRYLLFLNNDVQVTENWLKPLIETFDLCDNVGAVGPKILFPDGRLQEAGAVVNRDGTSKLVGVFDDPNLARYNYTREVMYCSGACLLVQAKTFRELGGFDTSLAPAYCEDWDFAFRLRELGLRVMYTPKSVIVHHLSITSNDVDQDFKVRCIVRNQQKLSEKWQSEIDELNRIRLIAFYLPQFHPIPENDRWWGKGFTEWVNVAKARPNYPGHYQPHVPADLGFYDLRVEDIMDQQAELAKRYGLYGFCYFYYWFAGKRLLELPLDRIAKTNNPNNRFCIAWANENWTRTWDGAENEVLIGQHHSDDDDRAVILDMIRYLRQPNYIRINGRPLLLVYRIHLFPNIKRTTDIWREQCLREGVGEIYLALMESFENASGPSYPSAFGFDASVEFPPHHMSSQIEPPAAVAPDFEGMVHDYREAVLKYLQSDLPDHVRFRTVMPSWDNTARRQNRPHIFEFARPGAYQAWLEAILDQTHDQNFREERIVFVNAWNEWGEGNHLEPDKRYGHGFLEATRNAAEAWLLTREPVSS